MHYNIMQNSSKTYKYTIIVYILHIMHLQNLHTTSIIYCTKYS